MAMPARDRAVHGPRYGTPTGSRSKEGREEFGGRGPRRKHEWPIIPTIRRITRGYRVSPGDVDHAPRRVRITHRATHHGRRTPLADSRTAARHRRQLRGGHDRAGRRQFVDRRGGRRGLRRGLRAGATTTTAAEATAPAAASSATATATASAAGGRGAAATAASPTAPAASLTASGAGTAAPEALALALAEAPGADRAAGAPGRRAADVPQTDPQTAAERTVAGVPDSAHHRPGGVRRRRAATAIIPLTRRDACPNGSY